MPLIENPLASVLYRQSTSTSTKLWGSSTVAADCLVDHLEITKGGPIASWRKKIADGQPAVSGLSVDAYELAFGQGEFRVERWRYFNKKWELYQTSRLHGALGTRNMSLLGHGTMDHSESRNYALMEFNKRARRVQTQLQAGIVIGEGRQTLQMIRHPLRGVYRLMTAYLGAAKKAVRKGGRKAGNPASRRKAIGNVYLEHVFGWLPLISDTQDAIKAAKRIFSKRLPRQYVKGVAGREGNIVGYKDTITATNFVVERAFEQRDAISYRIYGSVRVHSGWDGGVREIGLYPAEFLPTLWELLPYSFVVDYFTNAGKIIEAASMCRSDISWMCEGYKQERRIRCTSMTPVLPAGNATTRYDLVSQAYTDWQLSRVYKNRNQFDGSVIPKLEFHIPGLGLKWLNLSALVNQRL